MTIIANILLFIATFCILGLNTGALARPAPSGDAGVGYAWSLIMLNLVFCIVMIIVSIITGSKSGYSWLPGNGTTRTLLVIAGLISCLITAAIGSMFRNEMGATPGIVKTLITITPWIMPAILILGHFILVNNNIKSNLPPGLYKWPLAGVGIISMLFLVLTIGGFMVQANADYKASIENKVSSDAANVERMKAEIDSCDVSKNMVFILVLTDANQDPGVRKHAVAKVKSHPDYYAELERILQTGYADEAFHFLSSNDVDDPKRMAQPVYQGILKQAELFRERIRSASHPFHFYSGLFIYETGRILQTVDKYKGMGVDYKPAIIELRKALNQSSEYKPEKLDCEDVLDKWISNN